MEKVKFKINLDIITHEDVKEHPFVNISINGYPQFGKILSKPTTVDIDVEIQDETENFLTIEYMNKDPKLDIVFENNNIIKDKRVEIKSVLVNDIELDLLSNDLFKVLSYDTIDPQGRNTTGFEATKLSWNGRTTLKFTTPIYIWLLENL